MKDILIYGLGDFARLVLHYFSRDKNYCVVAFCADEKYIKNSSFCNLPIISFEQIENLYPSAKYSIFVAAGYSSMRNRVIMFEKVKSKHYSCVNYISPYAIIDPTLNIGENNIILENCVIEPFTVIGDNNIIWSSTNICHNVKIHSHSFIASQSLIGGFSEVMNNCFIGFNAKIIQNIVVGDETLVGANSLVIKDTQSYCKYLGSPAKKVSSHKEQGIKIK